MVQNNQNMATNYYDVCIVGSGPAGLSVLSAIREPFSIDHLTEVQMQRAVNSLHLNHKSKTLKVCVIDPNPNWMESWQQNFQQLNIKHLRSPTLGHPCMFDKNALFAYACQRGRQNELFENGCWQIKELDGLGQTQAGLWKLPSSKLFLDFCYAMTTTLKHTYLQGHVMDLKKGQEEVEGDDTLYQLQWVDQATNNTQVLSVRNVILATGTVGHPIVPKSLIGCRHTFAWNSRNAFTPSKAFKKMAEHVLVIGGGLTAVQCALKAVEHNTNTTCVLCSRRPLREKHFDIPVEWFDQRRSNKCLSDFYHDSIESRLKQLKVARDGGSVPPMYMKQLEQKKHRISCWVGDVEHVVVVDDDNVNGSPATENNDDDMITIRFQKKLYQFDRIIVACGVQPDCTVHPLVNKIQQQWPISIHGGLPDVDEDMRWGDQNIFVVGAMSGLQVGPDAGNLMGIRRSALVVADSLDCKSWLQEQVYRNKFDALLFSDSDSESDSDESDV